MRALAWILGLSLLIAVGALATQARDLSDMPSDEIAALQQRLTADGCYQDAIDGQASPALQNAIKACPSQDPILRIETGMHIAPIYRIGTDSACRIAATGSDDKTVRIWSLPDGRLLRTLRIPIGPGHNGKVFATAVSPDGHWVAVGGWDAQWDVSSGDFTYIFDVSTGALAHRIGPFSNVIRHLVFSPDGRWLAAANAVGAGIKVIDTRTWQVVADDSAYEGDSYGAAFGPNGRLYTVADDDKLRVYGPGPAFRKEREIATPGDPESIAVDPRGQLIALGFYDSTKINFYDATTLRFRFAADTKDVDNGNVDMLAWSNDGAYVVAGGMYDAQFRDASKYPVLTFGRDGKQIRDAFPLGDATIEYVQPCGNGFAVATGDPAFGLIGEDGQVKLWKTGVEADMRGKRGDAFTVAADAKQVRFGLNYASDTPVLLDLAQGTLTSAPEPQSGLAEALTSGLPVDGWSGGTKPTFDDKPIKLDNFEMSRAIAIRPDHGGFVLGGDFYIRAFDAEGRQLWQQAGPGVAWGVNLAADGRIIVAAYGDGTIRWLRWSDGKELLAVFVNRETKAWVAWTPSGYYMASPGGEDLIGWHVNRGWMQAADFFPASRFRERFNRPDIVRLVLDTLDEDTAIKRANAAARRKEDTQPLIQHLPPIIRISDPADGTHVRDGTVTLDYAVRSTSGQPVDRIDLVINGRPVKSYGLPVRRSSPDAETTGSIPVTLTQHVTEVGLIAWSEGLASQAAQVQVTWDGAPEVARKLYALVIGVSDYTDPLMTLKYAAKDAHDFANALQSQKGLYYADVQARVLTDREVTRTSVIEGLEWLEKMATDPNDVTVLFLSGHGTTDAHQTYWFYTADANDDDVRIKGVSQDELRESLQSLKGKVLWFLDTCHAGMAAKRPPVDINVLVNTVSASENGGLVVFASSTGRQVSVETEDLGNGAFTKAVVEGIALGKADLLGDGLITTSSLDTYVEHRVEQFTHNKQTPVMERPPQEPDFAIAEVRK